MPTPEQCLRETNPAEIYSAKDTAARAMAVRIMAVKTTVARATGSLPHDRLECRQTTRSRPRSLQEAAVAVEVAGCLCKLGRLPTRLYSHS